MPLSTALTIIQKESADAAGTGTIATTGTAVTGTTTAFTTELITGDVIIVAGVRRIITAIASNTAATLHQAYSPDIAGGTSFDIVTFTEVVFASDLSGPNQSSAQVDTSNFSDLGFGSSVPGLRQPGEMSFNIFYTPRNTIHAALQADFDAGQQRGWRMWVPDANDLTTTPPPNDANSRITFIGAISQFGLSAATNDAWKSAVTVLLASKPVVIAGPGT